MQFTCPEYERVYFRSYLQDYGAFETAQIQSYLLQVIEALVFLHRNGSYHGDLNCGNVGLDTLG